MVATGTNTGDIAASPKRSPVLSMADQIVDIANRKMAGSMIIQQLARLGQLGRAEVGGDQREERVPERDHGQGDHDQAGDADQEHLAQEAAGMAFAALAVRFGLERDDHAGEGIADDDGEELRDRPGGDEGIGRVRRSELGGEDDIAQHAGDLDADRAKGDDGNIEQELPVIPQTAEPAGDRQRATLDSHGWNHSTRITVRLVRASGFSMPQKSHGGTGTAHPVVLIAG